MSNGLSDALAILREERAELDQIIVSLERILAGRMSRTEPVPLEPRRGRRVVVAGPRRRDQLIDFLREHGPTKAVDIERASGIPQGTLANLLNDKWMFVSDNGYWRLLTEEEQRQREVDVMSTQRGVWILINGGEDARGSCPCDQRTRSIIEQHSGEPCDAGWRFPDGSILRMRQNKLYASPDPESSVLTKLQEERRAQREREVEEGLAGKGD